MSTNNPFDPAAQDCAPDPSSQDDMAAALFAKLSTYADPTDSAMVAARAQCLKATQTLLATTHRADVEERAAAAYHEAGHAVANVLACRNAQLPPWDDLGVDSAEIGVDGKAWGGLCSGTTVYHAAYVTRLPSWDWRDAMEWQLVISMSGGIAEAIHRGERRRRVVFQFARLNCGAHHDLADAEKVLADLRALPGRRYGQERYTQRALKLMLAHWPAVEAIAAVLIRDLRIEGSTIEELVP